jgi:hypothetical protein
MTGYSISTESSEVMTLHLAWQMAQAILQRTQPGSGELPAPLTVEEYGERVRAEYVKCYQAISTRNANNPSRTENRR